MKKTNKALMPEQESWVYMIVPKYLNIFRYTQSCLTLCDTVDCSPPGCIIHGILQARMLEWVGHTLLQGIFLTQGLNSGLLHHIQVLYHLTRESLKYRFFYTLNNIWCKKWNRITCSNYTSDFERKNWHQQFTTHIKSQCVVSWFLIQAVQVFS